MEDVFSGRCCSWRACESRHFLHSILLHLPTSRIAAVVSLMVHCCLVLLSCLLTFYLQICLVSFCPADAFHLPNLSYPLCNTTKPSIIFARKVQLIQRRTLGREQQHGGPFAGQCLPSCSAKFLLPRNSLKLKNWFLWKSKGRRRKLAICKLPTETGLSYRII